MTRSGLSKSELSGIAGALNAGERHQDAQINKIKEQQAEIKRLTPLAKFGEKVLDGVKECVANGGFELEAGTIADYAVDCGLMQYVPYDPSGKHVDLDLESDPGDMIYYWGKTGGE